MVVPEFRNEGEAVYFEKGRKGVGKDLSACSAADRVQFYSVFIAEVFTAQGETEPGFGVEVQIEGGAPPGMACRPMIQG